MKLAVIITISSYFVIIAPNNLDASIFGSPKWETVRVTWGINIFNTHVFEKMPLTESDAKEKGYIKINSECKGQFFGFRYMKTGNTSLILLYDVNGYLAGIQSGYPKDEISPTEYKEWFEQNPLLLSENLNGVEIFTITGYLVDPALICTTGRTADEFKATPAGTELAIQMKGSDPTTDLLKIPNSEEDIKKTSWTKGNCFLSMGTHYWYNTSKDMNCNNFLPAFLLYNRETLTGFGWAIPNMYQSDRFEHPPKEVFPKFFAEVPECLNKMYDKAKGFSTMHIYMNVKPWNIVCG